MNTRFMTAKEAISLIQSNKTITADGFVWGVAFPDELAMELEKRFLEEGKPEALTLFFAAGPGDKATRGFNRFGPKGMLKTIIGSHFGIVPALQRAIAEEHVDAYNLPMGVIAQSFRELAAGKTSIFSKVGLGTFVDPRIGGGRLNRKCDRDIAELTTIDGEEFLHYRIPQIDYAILRGTYADEDGNISMEKEVLNLAALSIATACHNNGGTVIFQVEKVVRRGTIPPKSVVVPAMVVDVVVPVSDPKYHMQNFFNQYDPAFCGEIKEAVPEQAKPIPDEKRRRIAERAFQEFKRGMVVNLGIGVPEYVATVAKEQGRLEEFTFTVEAGTIGGAMQSGTDFGCAKNPTACIDMAYMFDFIQSGGLDITCLGFAQVDREGNVNVSRIGSITPGVGGFIDISQNTKNIIFCGEMTAKGKVKFVQQVEQISFNGKLAVKNGQNVLYITEYGVFRLTENGLELREVLHQADLQRDILDSMEFQPQMDLQGVDR